MKSKAQIHRNKKNTIKNVLIIPITIILAAGIYFAVVRAIINNRENQVDNINFPQSSDSKQDGNDNSSRSSGSLKPFQQKSLKPIIYLYPEKDTELTVRLGKPESITASYPVYTSGWKVIAHPDSSLVNLDTGRSLYALYWEGESDDKPDMDEGFVVAGSDTVTFLEEKLAILGLTEREAEEFIVYWLPKMQSNPYNLIRFETLKEINDAMPLEFSVQPDTLIRVMMDYKPLDDHIEITEQKLSDTPIRKGFTVVEWGGSEIK